MFLPSEVNMVWQVVIQVRESNFVLRSYWLADDDLVDVIELIPVFISARSQIFLNQLNKPSLQTLIETVTLCCI